MPFSHRQQGSVDIISISGAFDAAEAPAIRDELKRIIDGGSARLIVNLADVQFIDSSGLSVLVTALKAARAKAGDLALTNLTAPVRSIIELTRLHRILEIFDDEQAALAKLAR